MKQARQGDIFFAKVSKTNLPTTQKKLNTNILAYGEVTGHSHKITSPAFSELESVVDKNGDIYVMSPKSEITVSHDEHNSITLPAGEWFRISRQREYDPIAVEKERIVAD